ncbi:HEAT repeat family protein [Cryptosporidium andersoni]|uniref:HEAT repeat family protein n=1 Tax=Cryptosporidium andersoni TaxID=117008 RepID=A0A1J4M9W5_9CRYT|nr:HEAT repeat family protein [Cryptosporidium andersoni]
MHSKATFEQDAISTDIDFEDTKDTKLEISHDDKNSSSRRKRWDVIPFIEDGDIKNNIVVKDDKLLNNYKNEPVKRSRWDLIPLKSQSNELNSNNNMIGINSSVKLSPDDILKYRLQKEIYERNKPWTDEELDRILPKEGYEIIDSPEGYDILRERRLKNSSINNFGQEFYEIPEFSGIESKNEHSNDILIGGTSTIVYHAELGELALKAEDYSFFAKLFSSESEDDLSVEEVKERQILTSLLKLKNGNPQQRRQAMRYITENAKELGAGPLFNNILPLLMLSTLEDQERHILVKAMDKILYKLKDLVRPYVHKILVVIEPMLIDQEYYARMEGREIISNLSKAVGLATMIATMRPDIDHPDEYVRNTTARAFAVIASALGIPSLIIFLQAVCQSKKSWQARHTGIKIVQQIAIIMGCAILPHLKNLVQIISHGLVDENQKVRMITALSIAALAEASAPYGIEAFDNILRPLWKGIKEYRGKGLAAFLKAIGQIIPLMDAHHANYYTSEVAPILVNEFSTPDDEMKRIVLKVIQQCILTNGVEVEYFKLEIIPLYFSNLWIPRNALDKRTYKQLVETTVSISQKTGAECILKFLIQYLKDSNESFRKMGLETINKMISLTKVIDIDNRLQELLIDGILYAFQEHTDDDSTIIIDSFGSILSSLGTAAKPYLPQISCIIRWRLNTPSAKVRQMAADLIARIVGIMKQCDEEEMLGHIGLFLYEYLGEEYPEVLGSIIGALKEIINVIGIDKMSPPIKDLLPRLTPILKNRHEKVQENVIDLIGCCANRGGDLISPKEWDRICFDLLDTLRANKKSIRRATVNTFGYIAKTIGPHDVLVTLLNNLRVQERQLRVCTTVAIAIISDICMPYTVLPALMNEYRIPDLNVQNGVLKTLSFMFEYIREMSKNYVYAITPLLESALTDRDPVHRQTATWACKHLALGIAGLGCDDALIHLLNYVWPNILETSPHLIQAVFEAIDAFRVSVGPGTILLYLLQGLFHPARRVRTVYWKLYNNLYIGSQDALVPFFPNIPDYQGKSFMRHELYYLI